MVSALPCNIWLEFSSQGASRFTLYRAGTRYSALLPGCCHSGRFCG